MNMRTPMPTPTVTISMQLFQKVVNVLTELPYKNVGGLINEIQAEVNSQQVPPAAPIEKADPVKVNAKVKPGPELNG